MTEVSAAAQSQQAQGQSKLATADLANNFDTFLTLLTEQLKNQDPLDPLKSEQFVQQLVQFSSVEQQIASNESLEALLALQQSDAQLTSLQFIGKDATVNTTYTLLENGEAKWEYGLPQEAQSVELLITDETGKQVRRLDGDTSEGVHEAVWDGKDEAGNTLPPGVYQLEVVAKDADDVIMDYDRARHPSGDRRGDERRPGASQLRQWRTGAAGQPGDQRAGIADPAPEHHRHWR